MSGGAFNDIFRELNIILSSKRRTDLPNDDDVVAAKAKTIMSWRKDDLVRVYTTSPGPAKRAFFLVLVMVEFAVFCLVIIVGSK